MTPRPIVRRRLGRLSCILLAVLFAGCASDAPGQSRVFNSDLHSYRVATVVTGLDYAWGMAFLPDGDILVTEKPGRLRIVRKGQLDPKPIGGVPEVYARSQAGLMDVALHPDFANNRLVYLTYSKPGPAGSTTAVIRGKLEGDQLTGVQEILEAKAWSSGSGHYGSRLAFDRQGFLYVTVGERQDSKRAQDLTDHAGSILRLHDDGRVPKDNPFVGRPGVQPEIYTWGNRNPQGLTVHPVTGELWESEHGPRGGDELNLVKAGANYGWPVITYGIDYDGSTISDLTAKEGMEQPVHYWKPSIGTSGVMIYNGDKFPKWKGDAFVGGMVGEQLARVDLDARKQTGHEALLRRFRKRIRDVRNGPDGFIYLLVDEANAPLLRLEPADPGR